MNKIIKNTRFIMRYITKTEKKIIALSFVDIICGMINTIIGLYISKWIFDGIGKRNIKILLFEISIIVFVQLCITFFGIFVNRKIFPFSSYNIQKEIMTEMICKIISIPKKKTDDPDFYNKMSRAIGDAKDRPLAVWATIKGLVSALLQGSVMLIATIIVDKNVAIIVLLSSVFMAVVSFYANKLTYNQYMDETLPQRNSEYIKRIIYIPAFCVDLKKYSMFFQVILNHFHKSVDDMKEITRKYANRFAGLDVVSGVISYFIIHLLPWGIVISRLYSGTMTIGSATVLLGTSAILPDVFIGIFTTIVDFGKHSMYIDNIREILNEETTHEIKRKFTGSINEIDIQGVSFAYPNQKEMVFENVNLHFNKGDKIGIYGGNGEGKTTFCMLLSGVYKPIQGNVLINGRKIENYDFDEINKKIVSVDQQYNIYSFSVIENIFMRNVNQEDYKRAEIILDKVNLREKIMGAKDKFDSLVTKEFDENGLCLSGGELQKIALARVFTSKPEIIILDEATCHIDKKTEKKILKELFTEFSESLFFIISHNNSLDNYVDRKILIENGKVFEI